MKLESLHNYAFGPGLALTGTAILLAFAAPTMAKEKRPVIERYQATAMSLDVGRAALMEIGIFGWNTAEERQDRSAVDDRLGDQLLLPLRTAWCP